MFHKIAGTLHEGDGDGTPSPAAWSLQWCELPSVLGAYPHLSTGEVLLLPDRDYLFYAIDRTGACLDRIDTMRGRHSDHEADLTDFDPSDPVGDGHGPEIPGRSEFGCDLLKHPVRHWPVGLVLKERDLPAIVAIAGGADECKDRSTSRSADPLHQLSRVDRPLRDDNELVGQREPPETGGISATSSPPLSTALCGLYSPLTAATMRSAGQPIDGQRSVTSERRSATVAPAGRPTESEERPQASRYEAKSNTSISKALAARDSDHA